MLDNWLDCGASARIYFQDIHEDSRERMLNLIDKNPNLELFKMKLHDHYMLMPHYNELISIFRTFHFTLFENPDQYYVERIHLPKSDSLFGTEFKRPNSLYEKVLFDALKFKTQELDNISTKIHNHQLI
ncbi:hypothetical protein J4408_03195 [Candidatus Pacearchaeota archaeon]|nr:hypothetical protein [Candidatus Pacearchaeota archaeon]